MESKVEEKREKKEIIQKSARENPAKKEDAI